MAPQSRHCSPVNRRGSRYRRTGMVPGHPDRGGPVHQAEERILMRRASTCLAVLGLAALGLPAAASAAPTVTFKATAIPIPGFPHTGNILGAGAAGAGRMDDQRDRIRRRSPGAADRGQRDPAHRHQTSPAGFPDLHPQRDPGTGRKRGQKPLHDQVPARPSRCSPGSPKKPESVLAERKLRARRRPLRQTVVPKRNPGFIGLLRAGRRP